MCDYFSGMICLGVGGTQMPDMVRKYSNKGVYTVYQIFYSLLLLLVGAVFIYTPGDIAATQVFGFDGAETSVSTWVIYGVIFVYYLIVTLFPIDKIIGRLCPVFGAILLFSAVGGASASSSRTSRCSISGTTGTARFSPMVIISAPTTLFRSSSSPLPSVSSLPLRIASSSSGTARNALRSRPAKPEDNCKITCAASFGCGAFRCTAQEYTQMLNV